jgi:hypothetical protein
MQRLETVVNIHWRLNSWQSRYFCAHIVVQQSKHVQQSVIPCACKSISCLEQQFCLPNSYSAEARR